MTSKIFPSHQNEDMVSGSVVFNAFLICFLISCNHPVENTHIKESISKTSADLTIKTSKENVTTIISRDTNELKRILDLSYYSPQRVNFHLNFIDNSGGNGRLTVPAPSDFDLQAVMYFDSITFNSILKAYSYPDWPDPHYDKKEFNFTWLDKIIESELENSDSNYHGHIDLFWTYPNDKNCHLWLLEQKILVHRTSQ